jgi:hypothetical protein
VGALLVDAICEAGVEDGDFDDAGIGGLETRRFDIDNGERLLGDAAVMGEEVSGISHSRKIK